MLGATTASMIEATNPEEAWPLAPPNESDLDWLRMSELKMAVWEVANPMREESAFYDHEYVISSPPDIATSGIDKIPFAFLRLFELHNSSTPQNNIYYTAVQTVLPILSLPYTKGAFVLFYGFVRHIQPAFKQLLAQKDSRALLLMAYWYTIIRGAEWWIERRATLECQAICIYLERYHADETLLQELLQFPKMFCDLGATSKDSSLRSRSSGRVSESDEV